MDAIEAGGQGPAPAPQPWAVPRQELTRAPRELPVRSAGWRRMDLTTACFEGAAKQNLTPLFTTCCQQPCPSSTEGVMCCVSCSALSVEKDNAFSTASSSHQFPGFGAGVWDADGSVPSAPARSLRPVQSQEGAVGMLEKRLCWQSRLDLYSGSYK